LTTPISNHVSKSADTDPVSLANGTQVGRAVGRPIRTDIGTQTDTPGPSSDPQAATVPPKAPKEIGGPPGPEPTRYGDWQYKGRCTDF
jgi:hypothetical protein